MPTCPRGGDSHQFSSTSYMPPSKLTLLMRCMMSDSRHNLGKLSLDDPTDKSEETTMLAPGASGSQEASEHGTLMKR